MGYDVHITRAEDWSDNEGAQITPEEWLAFVRNDRELTALGQTEHCAAEWHDPAGGAPVHIEWRRGNIVVKNPTRAVVLKMEALAERLGARVQGDDGEFYEGGIAVGAPPSTYSPRSEARRRALRIAAGVVLVVAGATARATATLDERLPAGTPEWLWNVVGGALFLGGLAVIAFSLRRWRTGRALRTDAAGRAEGATGRSRASGTGDSHVDGRSSQVLRRPADSTAPDGQWHVEGACVRTPSGQALEFASAVRAWTVSGDTLIAILSVPPGEVLPENVFAVGADGQMRWQIAPIPDHVSLFAGRYVAFQPLDDEKVRLLHSDNLRVEVEAQSGRILAVATAWRVSGSLITTPSGIAYDCGASIRQTLLVGDLLVVVLAVPDEGGTPRNVLAVSAAGALVWQAERVSPGPGVGLREFYMSAMPLGDGGVTLFRTGGWAADVDVVTGEVLRTFFTK
jgi:hypothetical protein